jgi:outer membrane murein-binding lipoprotein Lpp
MDDPSLGKIQSEIQSLQAELEQLEQDKQSNAT